MDRIKAAQVFIAIVEQGSMVKAAEALDISRSMVTRYLSEMEQWAGSRLLYRSTRRLGLTDAGEKVLAGCYKLQEIEQEVKFSSVKETSSPKGLLRISTSQFFAEQVLSPFTQDYLLRYPQVTIDMQISNHSVNLVEERIDLAIRITDDLDPNVIAKKFGQLNSVVCASPSYLNQRGNPQQIAHLQHHNCLTYSYYGSNVWQFSHEKKGEREEGVERAEKIKSVQVSGNLSANDPAVLLRSSLLGLGISLQPKYATMSYFDSQQLIQLFPEYTPKPLTIYGVYKSREYMPKAMRVLIDELALYIESLDL